MPLNGHRRGSCTMQRGRCFTHLRESIPWMSGTLFESGFQLGWNLVRSSRQATIPHYAPINYQYLKNPFTVKDASARFVLRVQASRSSAFGCLAPDACKGKCPRDLHLPAPMSLPSHAGRRGLLFLSSQRVRWLTWSPRQAACCLS